MTRTSPLLIVAACCALVACDKSNVASSASSGANPFFTESALPDHAPPFDKIHNSDYQPAIDEGMKRQLAEIDSIAGQTAPPTFDNTIVAMEKSGQLLTRVNLVFNAVTGANTNDTLQQVQTDEAPKLAAHADKIYLNAKLYARVKAIYDQRAKLTLTPEQRFLVERYHLEFVRAGAQLGDSAKVALQVMNQEEAKLSTEFQNKLLAATKAAALVVKDKSQLEGLSDDAIAAAADAAKQRKLDGQWVLPLQNTTQQPSQVSLTNRTTRQQLFTASTTRADRGDTNDTKSIVQRLVKERAARAKLFGFPNYAAYILDDQMARTPKAAISLLTDLVPAATSKARGEIADMQALIDKQKGGFTLQAWDWQYYAEQVRKAQYAIDETQIKPYFLLDTVLQDGVFYAAHQMYGLTFKERKDIPVYQPDVRVFEVFDANGQSMALFYCDYFKRDNKNGGAWMDNMVGQSGLLGTKPVVFNVANFAKPSAGQPALLTFDDVTTMFHEFGHALHGILSHVEYPTLSGTNVPRDFVEFPSQFNEHWASEPTVFAHYAKHYKTAEPMPQALVDKIKKSRTFNQGFATTEYLAAALLDMAWHTLPPGDAPKDVDVFEAAALKGYHIDLPQVPPRYRTTYFAHIFDNGYAAGYYAYLWAEVLDDDVYAWFTEHGGMTRENGQRFREMVLSRGMTEDVGMLFHAFTGRDPYVAPLLEQRGLTPAKK